ncbi:MAG: RNA 3'-terminal phosphate cyclase [Betaproteobacteria bacterium]|nr:RNA 3'-terminal phosphate cyclase [Betaproteobacteria bacterium]
MLILDGSQGEGGGQILRTALTLSMCTGQPFAIEKIRAGRKKPGLMRQHLTAVLAAQQICGARVEGAEVGSLALRFTPGAIGSGNYEFAIGTAGSVTLVLQTILPALLQAGGPSRVVLRGGTHNAMAPSFDFLVQSFLPQLRKMGAQVSLSLQRHGFYPAGGGELVAEIQPTTHLQPLSLNERGARGTCYAESLIAGVPAHVAQRELETVGRLMGWADDQLHVRGLPNDQGPGNVLNLTLGYEHVTEVVTLFGEKGVAAEAIAKRAVALARAYLSAAAPVGEYLADQLLLPMALAGRGEMTITAASSHTQTNAEVIQKFLPVDIEISPAGGDGYRVFVSQ